jgi:Arc/MetJ-type ribon-helix-helix transcriptional regulator
MLIQTKVQISKETYEFIKKVHKELHYKSLSEYVRDAINAKVREDRRKMRELKRAEAMEMIARAPYGDLFEPIAGDDFENR